MESILSFVLAAATALSPGRDHSAIGTAIANVIDSETPLFRDDVDKRRTASLIVAVGYREGSLRIRVEGDCDKHTPAGVCISGPHSFCTMQIHDTNGGSSALNDDPELCIRTGLTTIRRSLRLCPDVPLAWYAVGGGPERACSSAYGARISRDRMALAHWAYATATAKLSALSLL